MPTAAKLAALVLFGALAWAVSSLVARHFPEGSDPGRFAEVNAAVGAILGWRIAGSRGGTGWASAVGYGITATVVTVVVAAFLQCFAIMIRQSLRRLYDGPVEAVVDVFELMVRNGQHLLHAEVLLALALGGVLAGLLTEWVGRNSR
jgi:drug/metabolite transporter (DMT)-like permease